MQEATKDTIRVTLMGTPSISKHAPLTEAQEALNKDSDALELMALLFLSLLASPHDGRDPLNPKQTQFADREWLVTTRRAALFEENSTRARNRVQYLLDKINDALSIKRFPKDSSRERGDFGVNLGHLSIDAFQILGAAQMPHDEACQNIVIRLGTKRLLEGMDYPWLALSVFQALRQRLDDCYLEALCLKTEGLLFKMESATAQGSFDQASGYRSQALPLVDQAMARLNTFDFAHPLGSQVSHLLARATHLIAMRDAGGTAKTSTHNIPKRATSFVGREAEMTKLERLLGTANIVTIYGMGGCGKTRLALEAALDYAERTGEEVRLVELAGVADPDAVPQTVAAVFGLSDQKQGTYIDALIMRLQEGRPLLLLDNCEHLLDACAFLTEKLVQFCPNLTVLATSRELLNIDGEYPVQIEPLRAPPAGFTSPDPSDPNAALPDYEAARLFLDRIRPYDVAMTQENAAATASICTRLEGIPLALEMAAARAVEFSLPKIDEQLTDRFSFLTNGKRTASPRHGTLQAVIDWSYDLLTEREQTLFRRLSVFAGGWTTEAAQSVGASDDIAEADVPGVLKSLLQKSLITADTADSPARYGMLETIREYTLHLLEEHGESSITHLRHRTFFLDLAEEAEPNLRGNDPGSWLDRLDTEIDNLRAALAWCENQDGINSKDTDLEEWLRLAVALSWFWGIKGYLSEGRKSLSQVLMMTKECPISASRIKAIDRAGNLAISQGDCEAAIVLHKECLESRRQTEDRQGIGISLNNLGIAMHLQGDYNAAYALLLESTSIARLLDDHRTVGISLSNLGGVAFELTDFVTARIHFEEV